MLNIQDKHILIVEDDDMNYIYLKQIFRITGGNITRVKNGKSAIQTFKAQMFDLVLMDIQLPDINGYEVTRQIRMLNQQIPVVAQTASRAPEEQQEALDSGCNFILTKPYKIDEMKEILARVFSDK